MRLLRIDAGTCRNRCASTNIGTWPTLVARVSLKGMLTPKERQDQAKAWSFDPEALSTTLNHSWSFGDNHQELQEQRAFNMGSGGKKHILWELHTKSPLRLWWTKTWWAWCTTERPRSSSFQRPTCCILGKLGPSCQPWQNGPRETYILKAGVLVVQTLQIIWIFRRHFGFGFGCYARTRGLFACPVNILLMK